MNSGTKAGHLPVPRFSASVSALPSRQDMHVVAAVWEAFIAGERPDMSALRPAILSSWQRCHSLRINPHLQALPLVVAAEELEALQEQEDLIEAGVPLLEASSKAWEDEHFIITLVDRRGAILHMDGHASVLEKAKAVNGIPGGGMAEEHIGTAVANLVLAHGQADYVLWGEHYCQTFHSWATLGAPIRHPLSDEIIGVVMIAGDEVFHPRALELLEQFTAPRIELALHHTELDRRVSLLNEYQRFVLQHPHDIVLALDARGHVCGVSPASVGLLDTPQQLLERSILDVPSLQVDGLRPVTQQKDARPYDLHVNLAHKEFALQAAAIPVQGEKQAIGTLLVLPPDSASRSTGKRSASSAWTATYTFTDLIGSAGPFPDCLRQAQQAAQASFPVLLGGESGTGKELLAQAIHTASPRRSGPFVAVNCGLAHDELLAAELFGYVEGAFTGARKGGKKGQLELAHGGTLFLDEVEAMPAKMQVSLLRVLEEGQLSRVGSERPTKIDVRIIAASNEDLQKAIAEQRFRLDLYHRLCVFPIILPPLRARTQDIALLARHFLKDLGYVQLQVTPEALAILRQYDWPGNIRELKHVLLRAAHQADGTLITPAALPPEVIGEAVGIADSRTSLRDTERELIQKALAETNHNIGQAAAQLGIHRATLYRKVKRYGLSESDAQT